MNRAEHYEEAERLLEEGTKPEEERDYSAPVEDVLLAALIHAVLATYDGIGYTAEAYEKSRAVRQWSGGDR